MMEFLRKLKNAAAGNKSLLCVGLDPDLRCLPPVYRKNKTPLFEYNKYVVRSTKNLVCAYKPNSAFYESSGKVDELKKTIAYIKKNAPQIPVILDVKRGDIGNTASQYAKFSFDFLKADAVTLSPYMGTDSVVPFLEYTDKGIFILCLTSNKGSRDFQLLKSAGKFLYQIVAEKAASWKKQNGNIGLVVGATKPTQLLGLRNKHKKLPFLVPGLGTQGGDLAKSVSYGTRHNGICIFNVSRQVIFPAKGRNVSDAAMEIRNSINRYL